MFRGIERILQGRDPRDAWAFAQRICGVCTLVHGIASVRAVEDALGYAIPPNAQLIRNLMIGQQFVHDHVMHFYHLHALDWVDIVSALNADPAETAKLQDCLAPDDTAEWPRRDPGHFEGVRARLQGFVNSGQLGIFANGYWGHPAYKLCPELNLLAFSHYLDALAWQREVAQVLAIFGGKNPHPNFVVGGAPLAIDPLGETVNPDTGEPQMAVTLTKLEYIQNTLIPQMQAFVDQVYLPDVLAIGAQYTEWFYKGEGLGNLLTFGEFPNALAADPYAPDNLWLPRGAILGRDLSTIHDVNLKDLTQIEEFVSHAWYDYTWGKDQGLHPFEGQTRPSYTGPVAPYDFLDTTQPYSWLKSPRWLAPDGTLHAMEVGPLARVLMLYAHPDADPDAQAQTRALVDKILVDLKLRPEALFSTLGRTVARAIEAKLIADKMADWINEFIDNVAINNDRNTHSAALFDRESWNVPAEGCGFAEAPRGALGHWVKIDATARIENYQAVVPSTWNAGPRDPWGQPGAYEAALAGHTLHDPAQPLEILRTIHSFDPCLACALHLVVPDGEPLVQVKVR